MMPSTPVWEPVSFQTGAPQNPEMFRTFGRTKISAATDVVTARRIPPCLISV